MFVYINLDLNMKKKVDYKKVYLFNVNCLNCTNVSLKDNTNLISNIC